MTNTYLILTKAKWESALPAKLKKADRLSWNEYTYRDEVIPQVITQKQR